MNRSKSSNNGLSDRKISSPVASQDVTWKYSDSPVRRTKVASELPSQFANTPVRIIKRHASSPLPGSSSKALHHSRKLKTLVEFEQLSDDDSFNFSADFEITEDELQKVIEDADKMAKHERLVNLTSAALPQQPRPLRPKRQISDDLPIPLCTKRVSESDLPQTQVTSPKKKDTASSNDEFSIDVDNSYDMNLLSSIPIELLSSQAKSSEVEIRFDPLLKLSQIVPMQTASSSKATQNSSEKKFFKNRITPVPRDIPLNMTQKLQIAENRRQALKRLEETKKRRQNNKRDKP